MKDYRIALMEKPFGNGLTQSEVTGLFDRLNSSEAEPVMIEAGCLACYAMGFITEDAAEELDYDFSGLSAFIAGILDDMEKESPDCEYEFEGMKVWLSR